MFYSGFMLAIEIHTVWCGARKGGGCGCGASRAFVSAHNRLNGGLEEWSLGFAEFLCQLLRQTIDSRRLVSYPITIFDADVPGMPVSLQIDTLDGSVSVVLPNSDEVSTSEFVRCSTDYARKYSLDKSAFHMVCLLGDIAETIEEYLSQFPRPEVM